MKKYKRVETNIPLFSALFPVGVVTNRTIYDTAT